MPDASSTSAKNLLDQARAAMRTPNRTIELCQDVLKQSREELGEHEFCRAHFLLGMASRLTGELMTAESELFFAKQLAIALEDSALIARSSMQLGLVYLDQRYDRRAAELLRNAKSRFASLGMQDEEARACLSLSLAYRQMQDEDAAIATLEEALIKFTDVGSEEGIAAVHSTLVHISLDRGNYQEAKERAERSLKILPERSLPKNRLFLNLALASAIRGLGDIDRALEIINAAITSSQREEYPLMEARGLVLQHLALRDRGDLEAAKAAIASAEKLSDIHGFQSSLDAIKKENGVV